MVRESGGLATAENADDLIRWRRAADGGWARLGRSAEDLTGQQGCGLPARHVRAQTGVVAPSRGGGPVVTGRAVRRARGFQPLKQCSLCQVSASGSGRWEASWGVLIR